MLLSGVVWLTLRIPRSAGDLEQNHPFPEYYIPGNRRVMFTPNITRIPGDWPFSPSRRMTLTSLSLRSERSVGKVVH
ncbi:hypothetical protein BKA93DRAFT_783049 [Sparassis latifolia]